MRGRPSSIAHLPIGVEPPAAEFTVFNAFFRRSVFDRVRFDEARCKDYGYEDALFGLEVAAAGFSILPVDNPLRHLGIHSNEHFLHQTEIALRTLARLGAPMTERAKVAKAWSRLHRWRMDGVYRLLFKMTKSALRRNLLSQRPILFLFNLYKTRHLLRIDGQFDAKHRTFARC